MTLIINAANVHQGGGQTLLLGLLQALSQPAIVFADARLKLPESLPPLVQITRVRPTLPARFAAERRLRSLCAAGDILICFGNLPPLFRNPARVFVYLQNRYLTSPRPLTGLPWRTRARIAVERLWLRACLRDATVLVQTASVADEVRSHLGRASRVAPFAPEVAAPPVTTEQKDYDFVYVASGEAHKNHRRLVEAWELLAAQGHYPSLRLTLDASREADLVRWVADRAHGSNLQITNGEVAYEAVTDLYGRAASLIHPSFFESFGLPLIEADRAGLAVLAVERDYVRDVVTPAQTFDPDSALSIARAVLRHLQRAPSPQPIMTPGEFLASVLTEH